MKPVAETIRAQATALRAQADALEALAGTLDATPDPADGAEMLDLEALKREFQLGRASVLAAAKRGELEAVRGSRGRVLVARAAVARWLDGRRVVAEERLSPPVAPLDELEAWDRQADAKLRVLPRASGGRR